MPVLSKRIVLDCFYLLIFYFEKFSTDVCRLPCAVNVNLNLSFNTITLEMMQGCDWQKRDLFVAQLLTSKCCSVRSSVFTDYTARKANGTSSVVSCKNHDNSSCWGNF